MSETATRKYKRLSKEEIARAKKLVSEGMTAKVIADNLGVSTATIYKVTSNGNGAETSRRVAKSVGLVQKVRLALERLESRVKFHQEQAEKYQGQIAELKNVFNS